MKPGQEQLDLRKKEVSEDVSGCKGNHTVWTRVGYPFIVVDGSAQALRQFSKFVTRSYGLVVDSSHGGPHDGARKQLTHSMG